MNILITGGASNGKSTYAEKLLCTYEAPYYYVATMKNVDAECNLKIKKHQMRRKGLPIETIEKSENLQEIYFPEKRTIILECLVTLVANEMFDDSGNEKNVFEHIIEEIDYLQNHANNLIVVTNEVGQSVYSEYDQSTQHYIDMVGKINCALAARFDKVIEVVSGIPMIVKG